MKKRKLLTTLLALAVAAGALTACSGGDKTPATSSEAAGGTSQTSSAEQSENKPSGEIPTLVWYQIGEAPANLADGVAAMNEYTADKIGVKVELKFLDWGVWSDKVKTIVSTGEPYDMMFTNSDFYAAHVNMGALMDITDLLDAEAPALKSFIPEDVWKGVKIKDRIYSVPTYKDSSQRQYWVWDKEMVDKYSIDYENIVTLADLDPVLRQIKEGEGKSFYPFILDKNGVNGQFMYFDSNVRYDDETATVQEVLEREEMVNFFRQIHAWYKDGIINPDAPTTTELPKVRTCFSAQGFPGANVTWSANMGKEVVSQPWSPAVYTTGTILGSVNAISSNSKYPAEALKYLELANTDPTLRNMLAYGVEDVNFKVLENKTIEKLNDVWTAPAYSQATFFTMYPVSPNPPDQWTLVQKQNEEAVPSILLGFTFDRTPVEAELTALDAVGAKYNAELYTGAKDPDLIIPQYLADKKAAGSEKILAEYQKQINEFLGK